MIVMEERTEAAAATRPPDQAVEERVELVPLDAIVPSPHQPRVFPDKPPPALVDLARSIRATSQVQPAIVRLMAAPAGSPGDRLRVYQLVAGERRWRACRLRSGDPGLSAEASASLDAAGPPPAHLRAIVRELTDEQAAEVCTVENLDREDLAPLEEANGVATLMGLYHGDVEAVAARLGRPVHWVAARHRLAALSPKWRKALADEERGFSACSDCTRIERQSGGKEAACE